MDSNELAALLLLFLGNILFGSIPLIISKIIRHFCSNEETTTRKAKWVTFLLYTGAGIFISDSFVVLLPQANKEFANPENHTQEETGNSLFYSPSEKTAEHHHDSFPFPEFVVLCGFFFAYILQETVYFLLYKFSRNSREANDMRVRFCSCAKRHTECSRTFKDARPDQTLFGLKESDEAPTGAAENISPEVVADAKSELLQSSILAQVVPNYGTITNVTVPATDNPLPVLTPPVLLDDERRLIVEHHSEKRHHNKFLMNNILILIALTLQYFFLGIHLGLRKDYRNQWPYLLVAFLQNFILTFSAGSHLAVGHTGRFYVAFFIGLLSVVSPIGMIVATAQKNVVEKIPHLATGIVSAVACGTLLYVTFYDMLRQKYFGSVVGVTKFLAITIGASFMIALQYATTKLRN